MEISIVGFKPIIDKRHPEKERYRFTLKFVSKEKGFSLRFHAWRYWRDEGFVLPPSWYRNGKATSYAEYPKDPPWKPAFIAAAANIVSTVRDTLSKTQGLSQKEIDDIWLNQVRIIFTDDNDKEYFYQG